MPVEIGAVSEIPAPWLDWALGRTSGKKRAGIVRDLPAYVKGKPRGMVERALGNLREAAPQEDIAAALAVIPNPTKGWDEYNRVLMTVWASCEGAEWGRELARWWSRKNALHADAMVDERWAHYFRSPPVELGFGTLVHLAREVVPGWEAPSRVRREVFPDWGDCPDAVPSWEAGL